MSSTDLERGSQSHEAAADAALPVASKVTHLNARRDSDLPEGEPESEHSDTRIWWLALGAIAAIALIVVASVQTQRANALEDAVGGLNAQLQTTRGVLHATEADLEATRDTLGVYADTMDHVRGSVASIAEQLGALGSLVAEDALPTVPDRSGDRATR